MEKFNIFKAKVGFDPETMKELREQMSRYKFHKLRKGDLFHVLEVDSTQLWWRAVSLKDRTTGLIPAKYIKRARPSTEQVVSNEENTQQLNESELRRLQAIEEVELKMNFGHSNSGESLPEPDYSSESDLDDIDHSSTTESRSHRHHHRHHRSQLHPLHNNNHHHNNNNDHNHHHHNPQRHHRHHHHEANVGDEDEDDDDDESRPAFVDDYYYNLYGNYPNNGHYIDEDGLIQPKKLRNPCLESKERQMLHQELLMKSKNGHTPLPPKTELQKVFLRRRETTKKKEREQEDMSRRTTLEKVLQNRINRLQLGDDDARKKTSSHEPEFVQMRAKLRTQRSS